MPSYHVVPAAGAAAGTSAVQPALPNVARRVERSVMRCISKGANSCVPNACTSRGPLHWTSAAAAGAAFPLHMPATQSIAHVVATVSTSRRSQGCMLPPSFATLPSKAACHASHFSAPPEAPDFASSVYVDADAQPQHFVGPIAVASIPGKGRGLVATTPLEPGQLLLVVPPLAILEGQLGDIPEHEELIEVITASGALFSPWQADWLRALTTTVSTDVGTGRQGPASSSRHSSDSLQQQMQQVEQQSAVMPEVPAFLPPAGQGAWMGAGAGAAAGDAANAARVPFAGVGMDDEQLWAATVLNCYGEGFPDLPASLCAGAPLMSQLGLWGPFSLLNHACCPNAVNYTLRDCMVVRCCAPVAAGEEVTINYLGRSVLTPLSQRQAELEASYGFTCHCRRCCAEAAWSEQPSGQAGVSLTDFLDQLHLQIGQDFEPRQTLLREAWQEEDSSQSGSSSQSEQQLQQQQLLQDLRLWWSHLQDAAKGRQNSSITTSSNTDRMGTRDATAQSNGAVAPRSDASLEASSDRTAAMAPMQQPPATGEAWQQQQQQQQQQQEEGEEAGVPVSVEDAEAAWVLASGFDLLGLLYDVAEGCEQHEPSVLAAIVTVCERVCPGSDLHLFQALRLAETPQQLQQQESVSQQQESVSQQVLDQDDCRGGQRTLDPDQCVVRALRIRYGQEAVAEQAMLDRMRAAAAQAADMVWM